MVDLTVIKGDKNRPFFVSEMHDEAEDGEPTRPIELVICHRNVEMVITSSGVVPTNRVITPPIPLADRAIAEAFCEALNTYHQFWEEFDWDSHPIDEFPPICPGSSTAEAQADTVTFHPVAGGQVQELKVPPPDFSFGGAEAIMPLKRGSSQTGEQSEPSDA